VDDAPFGRLAVHHYLIEAEALNELHEVGVLGIGQEAGTV
jgi:hypothetical protein